MPTLVAVRHGRSSANVGNTLAGRTPGIALDDVGRSQAMGVGERLRGITPAVAVRSPLLRCHETMDLALQSAALDLTPLVDDRLIECDYGDWTGKLLSELTQTPLWQTVQSEPSKVRFPGGEAMLELRQRVLAAVADRNASLDERDVWLLVGHADPIRIILAEALGAPFDDFQRICVDPASISVIHYPSLGKPLVLTVNALEGQLRRWLPSGPVAPVVGGGSGTPD